MPALNMIKNVGQHVLGNLRQSSNGGKYAFRKYVKLEMGVNAGGYNQCWEKLLLKVALQYCVTP